MIYRLKTRWGDHVPMRRENKRAIDCEWCKLQSKADWVFNKPFYIIINLAVGGNFPGNPDSGETFPHNMLVDYVRVYKNSNN